MIWFSGMNISENLRSGYFLKIRGNKDILRINKSEAGEVYASDIEADTDIEILNPEQLICTLAENASINMEMTIGHGRGYNRAEENKLIYGEAVKQNTISNL